MIDRQRVIVDVDDVNEFSPVWTDQLYTAEIDEGSQRQDIIQVAATDADGSPGMSKICQYHVVTPGAPFEVDDLGKYILQCRPPIVIVTFCVRGTVIKNFAYFIFLWFPKRGNR